MPTRFATTEQVDFVTNNQADITAYHDKFKDVLTAFAGICEAVSPESGIEIRFISAEGRDEENWRGNLLSASKGDKVDVFCLGITGTQFLDDQQNGIGYFKKVFTLGIDYFYDYDFGTDDDNSEAVFSERIDSVEYFIEQLRVNSELECLPSCSIILSGATKRGIKQFKSASTHFAKTDILLSFDEDDN